MRLLLAILLLLVAAPLSAAPMIVVGSGGPDPVEGSLRPEIFGPIPSQATLAGFAPNDLSTSVRTDVTPTTRGGVIEITGGSYDTPYAASTANRTYRLMGNVTYEGCGIRITASNVTIDLNGYTLTYHNVAPSDVETASVDDSGGGGGVAQPTLDPTGLTLTANSHLGCIVEFTSGDESGNIYEVVSNTTTTLTLENHNNITDQPDQGLWEWQDGGPDPSDTFRIYDPRKTFGVGVTPGAFPGAVEVVNGFIVEGAGYGRGCNSIYSSGINPIQYLDGGAQWTVGGVSVKWNAENSNGINLLGSVGAVVKYCEIEDEGTIVTNRQRGTRAVVTNTDALIQYNRFTNFRQASISTLSDSTVELNEMYGESHATNSTGAGTFSQNNVIVRNNNIYQVGQHPVGIGISQASNNCEVYGNWVETMATLESPEYGFNLACALAIRGGGVERTQRNHYHDNAFITYAHDSDYKARTINLTELGDATEELIEDNFIGSYTDDGTECHCTNMGQNPVHARNNILESTQNIYWVADNFDPPIGFSRWINNTTLRHGEDAAFSTFKVSGFWDQEVDFISGNYSTGTAVDDFDGVEFVDADTILRFGWLLTVTVTDGGNPVEGATVTIRDKDSNILRDDYLTDENGEVVVDVPTYYRQGPGFEPTTLAPLTVEAEFESASGDDTISPTADDAIEVAIE